jgi:hypothetical protein
MVSPQPKWDTKLHEKSTGRNWRTDRLGQASFDLPLGGNAFFSIL